MSGTPSPVIYNPSQLLQRYDPENRLKRYFELLLKENKRLNLVSRETGVTCETGDACFTNKECVGGLERLAAQSLLPLEVIDIPQAATYLDIGSGGGFPAVPIIMTQSIHQATLVERTQKKAAALRRILIGLDMKADIISSNFEETAFDTTFNFITLRQVKLTPRLLRKILSVLAVDGVFVYYSRPDFEIKNAGVELTTYCYTTDSTDPGIRFTTVRKLS
jgi:16S rRNA G527 N7-methylase RsmG